MRLGALLTSYRPAGRSIAPLWLMLSLSGVGSAAAQAAGSEFPQIITTGYDALDQKAGGQFVIWSEREKIFYGLDPKLYPGARHVEVSQITPSPGSITLTFIEISTVSGSVPDYLYLTGNVRFRISGMKLVSSNFPAGQGLSQPAKP